jgi:hypothetical protein
VWVVLALCLALVAPLAVTDVPPLLDYPNHVARLHALAFLPSDPILAQFYAAHWAIIPNLALDLTMPPLMRILPACTVGRIVVGITLLLPVFGALAYHRALAGRLSYWPLGIVLFAWNAALLRGFLNFVLSVGLAQLLAAVWLVGRERRPALVIPFSACGAVVLFFCHLTGLLYFAILIGGHELAMLLAGVRDTTPLRDGTEGIARPGLPPTRPAASANWSTFIFLKRMARSAAGHDVTRRLAAGIVVFAPPAALYASSDLSQMRGDATFRSIAGKAAAVLDPVVNYNWPLDLITAGFCAATATLCLARRWCVMPSRAASALVVLLALFVVLPTAFKGTFDLDTRFIIMAGFLAPAALVSVRLPRPAASVIAVAFLLLFSTRMIVVLSEWHHWARDVAAFRQVIAPVRPGDVVLTLGQFEVYDAAHRLSNGTIVDTHLPALLLIEHDAWWPYLFDNPSQQPIRTREPFRTAADLVDGAEDPLALLRSGEPGMRPFTHVLVLGLRYVAPDGLVRLTGDDQARLFRIDWTAISRAPPPAPRPDR